MLMTHTHAQSLPDSLVLIRRIYSTDRLSLGPSKMWAVIHMAWILRELLEEVSMMERPPQVGSSDKPHAASPNFKAIGTRRTWFCSPCSRTLLRTMTSSFRKTRFRTRHREFRVAPLGALFPEPRNPLAALALTCDAGLLQFLLCSHNEHDMAPVDRPGKGHA